LSNYRYVNFSKKNFHNIQTLINYVNYSLHFSNFLRLVNFLNLHSEASFNSERYNAGFVNTTL
jgi:hypothetical protein